MTDVQIPSLAAWLPQDGLGPSSRHCENNLTFFLSDLLFHEPEFLHRTENPAAGGPGVRLLPGTPAGRPEPPQRRRQRGSRDLEE